jgi:predicted DCC family thiol-disulfide oxidoreductase YuxK
MWIQNSSTADILSKLGVTDFNPSRESMIVIDHGRVFRRSDAVIRVFSTFTFFVFRVIAFILGLLPRPVRNYMLGMVAARRYSIAGKRETCGLPDRKLKSRFLHPV